MASAELRVDVPFTLHMQGSERFHQLQQQCRPKQHHLFTNQSVWLGVVAATPSSTPLPSHRHRSLKTKHWAVQAAAISSSSGSSSAANGSNTSIITEPNTAAMDNNSSTTAPTIHPVQSSSAASIPFAHRVGWPRGGINNPSSGDLMRFSVLQHLQHHRALGFAGSIIVVTAHTADALMQSKALRRAMHRNELVVVLWDAGLEACASHFMQIPSNNLLRLASWGSQTYLGLWDLDEYLVLPQHKPIGEEVGRGCLKGTLSSAPEAVIGSTWVASASWSSSPEVVGWMSHGTWSAAVQGMDYAAWPYTFCDGVCKALVDPNTDLLFQVHQHIHPARHAAPPTVDRSCAHILHFFRLWKQRQPELMTRMVGQHGRNPGTPLKVQEVLAEPSVPAAVQQH